VRPARMVLWQRRRARPIHEWLLTRVACVKLPTRLRGSFGVISGRRASADLHLVSAAESGREHCLSLVRFGRKPSNPTGTNRHPSTFTTHRTQGVERHLARHRQETHAATSSPSRTPGRTGARRTRSRRAERYRSA
jgi:hypothetical protein